jgi:ABC-2 type transport system ATP-binding protein
MKTMIETKNITKKYQNALAVNDVSLTVRKGDIYGLVGKNGAGKTTLFKLILGLIPPSSGSLLIQGCNTGKGLSLARSNVSFMIGTPFFSYLTAYQNIEYYRKLKGIADPEETKKVLKITGLDHVKKPFKYFSMGMKQRLGIAHALLGLPDIIILDEPVNGLDPQGIFDIRAIIKRINEEHGITFIISSHILSELEMIATEYGFIDHGKLLKEIDCEELHRNTQKSLVIQVDDIKKAAILLETELSTKNYKINKYKEIVLNDFIKESDKVAQIFVQNGLRLFKLEKRETTLEEYFMNLIGDEPYA